MIDVRDMDKYRKKYGQCLIYNKYNNYFAEIHKYSEIYDEKDLEYFEEYERRFFSSVGKETDFEKYIYELNRTIDKLNEQYHDENTPALTKTVLKQAYKYLLIPKKIADTDPASIEKSLKILDHEVDVPEAILRLVFIQLKSGIKSNYQSVCKRIYDKCTSIVHFFDDMDDADISELLKLVNIRQKKEDYARTFSKKYDVDTKIG